MFRTTVLSLVVAVAGVAACQRAEDPAKAGFLDGILNLADGTYDDRLEAKQRERHGLESANAALAEQVKVLEGQKMENARRMAATERQLNETQQRIATLKRRYSDAEGQYQQELAELKELESALDEQRAKLVMVSNTDADQSRTLAETSRRVQELSRIVALMPD
jgi:chromosome segregation ATPase